MRLPLTGKQKDIIINRAKARCEYCQTPELFSPQSFNFDHIYPFSKGGLTSIDNIAYACGGCNLYKSDKVDAVDPSTDTLVPLFNPRKQEWDQHFIWNKDFTLLIGTTPCGRATVQLLKMNRPGLIYIRTVLRLVGHHPPSNS